MTLYRAKGKCIFMLTIKSQEQMYDKADGDANFFTYIQWVMTNNKRFEAVLRVYRDIFFQLKEFLHHNWKICQRKIITIFIVKINKTTIDEYVRCCNVSTINKSINENRVVIVGQ